MMRLSLALFVLFHAVAAEAQDTVMMRGVVVADDSGAPIAGARVALGGMPVHVRTDASGRFEFRVPKSGFDLAVVKPGFARVMVPRPATDQDVTLRLVRSAALTVRVIDLQGEPVAGTSVRIACSNGTSTGPSNDLGERRDGSLRPGPCRVNVGNVGAWLRVAGEPTIDQLTKAIEQLRTRAPEANASAKAEETTIDLRAGEEASLVALDASPPARPTVSVLGEAVRLPPGKGSVRGRILGPGRRPVEGARVTVGSSDGSLSTFSGPTGEYAFDDVPAGRFRVRASRPGLASREFGQTGSATQGRDVALGAGERLAGVDVALTRGSAITGGVTGDAGEPIEGLGVQLFRFDDAPGRTRSIASLPALTSTDDRGRFRLAMVPPGSYYVGAVSVLSQHRTEGPVYFPGRIVITEAVPLTVEAGLDYTGVDIPFSPSIGVPLRGRAYGPAGPLTEGIVELTGSDALGSPLLPRSAEMDSTGFEFLHLPPGTYTLSVRSPASAFVWAVVRDGQVTRSQVPPTQFGRTRVVVGTTPPPPVVISTSAASTLSGRIVLEGPMEGVTPRSFQLAAQPVNRILLNSPTGSALPIAEIAADRTFRMTGLSEPMRITFDGPPGWWLKSLTIDGVDLAGTLIPFGTPEASHQDAVAVFSHTAAQISGSVSDEKGRAMSYQVVAFPVDTRGWFIGSQRVRVGRPNQAGAYSLSLPPGDYWLAAVDSLGVLGEKTLEGMVPFAVAVTVEENQRAQKDLRLARTPK